MPKFSREYLRQATNPGMFGLGVMGLGEQLGTALQGRRARDAQMQMMTLGNQAISASEQGDMQALNMRRQQLMELLSKTTNAGARDNIINAINQINSARPATQARATTNTANAIIKTEKALEDMKDSTEPMTNEEYMQNARLQSVLEERLAVMKQNSKAVVEADEIKLSTTLKALEDKEKLNTAKKQAAISELEKFVYGSEKYKAAKEKLISGGLNAAVQDYENIQMEFEQTRLELQEEKDKRKPLTEEQKQFMRDNRQTLSGDVVADRAAYFTFLKSKNEATRTIALRNLTEVSGGEAKARVRLALLSLQSESGAEVQGLEIWQDLNDEIENLSEDDLQEIYDMAEGKTITEINQLVRNWVQDKFKSEFDDMLAFQDQEKREADEKEASIDAVIAFTNSERQKNNLPLLDPSDPQIREEAWVDAQEKAAKQRAMKQAQGVGGRAL